MNYSYPHRLSSILALTISLFVYFSSHAQTPTYAKNTGNSGNSTFAWGGGSSFKKGQLLYLPGDFSPAVPAGGSIDKIYFMYGSTGQTASHTFTNFNLKLGQTTNTAFSPTTTFYTGLTTVLSSASYVIPAGTTGNWMEVVLTTPFAYDQTKTLIMEISFDMVDGSTSALGLGTYSGPTVSGKKLYANSVAATTGSTNTSLQNFGFNLTMAPCTSPPTPGSASATAALVCSGGNATLNLTGNSTGSSQTYQWESSASVSGPYTALSPVQLGSSYNINPTTSLYYQCAVTCGGNTQYSTPVLVSINPGMAGVYTIDASAPASATNFQSFTSAINAMGCGITGPVTFNVAAGGAPYNEQVTIPAISGSSAINTITFNGNGNTITYTGQVTGARHVVKLTGADYVTFNNLNITGGNATYGYGVHLMTASDHVTLNNCVIDMTAATSTTAASSACVVASNSASAVTTEGNNASYLTINGCTLKGAYQSIILYGNTGVVNGVGNVITNNTIQDFYANGIELAFNDGATVSNNDIKRDTRTAVGSFEGIELNNGTKNTIISGNRIHDTHNAATTQTGLAYGIYSSSCDAPVGSENWIYNNLMYNFNSGSGTIYAFYSSGSDGVYYYHNTISFDNQTSTAGTTRGFFQTTLATNVQFRNNVVSISRTGSGAKNCIYLGTTTSTIICNNNVLYVDPAEGTPGVGTFGTTNYLTIFDWKTANANAYDQASFGTDPGFTNLPANNFIPTSVFADNIGANVGIGTDITGAIRSATPDPGAYEFTAVACSGVPTAGTTVASTNIICTGLSFALTLSGNSLGTGQTFQWQSSPDNFSWTDIPGANTYPYFLSQTASTYYRCKTVCGVGSPDYSTVVYITTPATSLNGSYTVDATQPASATNFQKLSDAAKTCNCGIAGPVTLNLAPGSGPYNDQVMFSSTSNSSVANPIVVNGNGNTINFAPISSARHIIKLDGADYVTLNNLTVVGLDPVFGWGIHLTNAANNITINNCTVNMSSVTSTLAANSGGIVATGNNATIASAGNNASNLLITSCTVIGGSVGISLYGNAGALDALTNTVTQNVVRDFYTDGIVINNNDGAIVSNNDVSRANRLIVSTFTGIALSGDSKNTLVAANKIHDTHNAATAQNGAAYGILLSSDDATLGTENRIQNNIIYNFNSLTGTQYGLYNSGSAYVNYYHNTIVLNNAASTSGTTKGVYQTTAAVGIQFVNNIFFITRGGSGAKNCLDFSTTTSTIVSNNNLLFISSPAGTTFYGSYGSTDYPTFTGWQGANANAYDQQSGANYPDFVNMATNNFIPMEMSIDNIGAPGLGVTTDFNGNLRAGTPDVGAFEFTGTVLPLSLLGIMATCQNANVVVSWSVAGDDNIATYDVERSANGLTFEKIGEVAATGSSNYRFTDRAPQGNVLYYRLKINENNGRSDYSSVVVVKLGTNNNDEVIVFPNPFTDKVSIKIVASDNGQANIKLTNIYGETIRNEVKALNAGTNLVGLDDLKVLPPGLYNVYVEINGNKYVQKLVK